MSFNKCFLMGTIKQKKLKSINGGSILFFTVRTWDQKKQEFLDCVAYNNLADIIDRDFQEEDTIFLEGKIHSFTDNNQKKSQIIVERFKNYSFKNTNCNEF